MSIQPNRVVARIVDQVDQSDWPRLESSVVTFRSDDRWLRLIVAPRGVGHATAIHFWVHALRDELATIGRRVDLVGAAGQALCRKRPLENWLEGLREAHASAISGGAVLASLIRRVEALPRAELHVMLESECRLSSVLDAGDFLAVEFWGHGSGVSWKVDAA